MGQAGVKRLPHYTCSGLIVELQGKLDISRRLRSLNHSGSRTRHRSVGYRQVDAVKRIQEVRTKLQSESFGQLKIFLQAQIPVVVSGATQTTELRCASSKAGRVGIIAGIEPEESAPRSCGSRAAPKHGVCAVAVGTQAA